MYAWEPSYSQRVEDIREDELKTIQKGAWISAVVGLTWFSLPYMVNLDG